MKIPLTPSQGYHRTNLSSLMRVATIIAVVAFIGIPFFSSSSASSVNKKMRANQPAIPPVVHGKTPRSGPSALSQLLGPAALPSAFGSGGHLWLLNSVAPPTGSETIEVFAADCTTPKLSFNLGETVCAMTQEESLFLCWVSTGRPLYCWLEERKESTGDSA